VLRLGIRLWLLVLLLLILFVLVPVLPRLFLVLLGLLLFQVLQLLLYKFQVVFGVGVLGVECEGILETFDCRFPFLHFPVRILVLFATAIERIAHVVVGALLQLEVGRSQRQAEVGSRVVEVPGLVGGAPGVEMQSRIAQVRVLQGARKFLLGPGALAVPVFLQAFI